MTEGEFQLLRRFLKTRSGLDLGPEKRYLAESRLTPLLGNLGFGSLGELIRGLAGADAKVAVAVASAMATQETMFFRDRAPFEMLSREILPRLIERRSGEKRIRIWSAAASTGQEAYSLAMLLAETKGALPGWSVSILGTDLSPDAVARARSGLYSQHEVQRGLPVRHLISHFEQEGESWRISPALRAAVEFRPFNLLDSFAGLGTFDIIFCRNLLIYLDRERRIQLLDKLAERLAPDGILCLGSAEHILGHECVFTPHPEFGGFFARRSAGRVAAERMPSDRLDAAV